MVKHRIEPAAALNGYRSILVRMPTWWSCLEKHAEAAKPGNALELFLVLNKLKPHFTGVVTLIDLDVSDDTPDRIDEGIIGKSETQRALRSLDQEQDSRHAELTSTRTDISKNTLIGITFLRNSHNGFDININSMVFT